MLLMLAVVCRWAVVLLCYSSGDQFATEEQWDVLDRGECGEYVAGGSVFHLGAAIFQLGVAFESSFQGFSAFFLERQCRN